MNLRRYAPMKQSRGTVIPPEIREAVLARDKGYCVCERARFPSHVVDACPLTPVELDHIRASHGMGMKSETTVRNLVSLSNPCHRWKTEHGRVARPLLLDYVERVGDCGHIDRRWDCDQCQSRPLKGRSAATYSSMGRVLTPLQTSPASEVETDV
jgi:hypothetical protein